MSYEDLYKEFKNSLEDDYNKFISSFKNLSASQSNNLIDKKLIEYFKESLTQRDRNEVKYFIFLDIKDNDRINEYNNMDGVLND